MRVSAQLTGSSGRSSVGLNQAPCFFQILSPSQRPPVPRWTGKVTDKVTVYLFGLAWTSPRDALEHFRHRSARAQRPCPPSNPPLLLLEHLQLQSNNEAALLFKPKSSLVEV